MLFVSHPPEIKGGWGNEGARTGTILTEFRGIRSASVSICLPYFPIPLISGVVAREKAPLILVRVHFLANLYFVSHPTPREIKGDGEVREPARG